MSVNFVIRFCPRSFVLDLCEILCVQNKFIAQFKKRYYMFRQCISTNSALPIIYDRSRAPSGMFHNALWTSVITELLLKFDAFDYSIIIHIIIIPIYYKKIKKQFYSLCNLILTLIYQLLNNGTHWVRTTFKSERRLVDLKLYYKVCL